MVEPVSTVALLGILLFNMSQFVLHLVDKVKSSTCNQNGMSVDMRPPDNN